MPFDFFGLSYDGNQNAHLNWGKKSSISNISPSLKGTQCRAPNAPRRYGSNVTFVDFADGLAVDSTA